MIGLTGRAISNRISRAAESAGIGRRLTAHSGRIGLACAMVEAGYLVAAIQLAGGWKSTVMIAHYAGPLSAESGAVAQCFAGVEPAGPGARRTAARIVQFAAAAGVGLPDMRG